MCNFCEQLKNVTPHIVHIDSDMYQKRPYPHTEPDMGLDLDIIQKGKYFYLVANSAAYGGTRLFKGQLSMNVKVSSQIYYCPYCGERL